MFSWSSSLWFLPSAPSWFCGMVSFRKHGGPVGAMRRRVARRSPCGSLVAPSIQAAAKLAIALGKSLDHMAGLPAGIGPSASDPATTALIAKLQQLPPDRRELVKALIYVLAEKK